MKLISCHIENFGKLHAFSCDFKPGINVIFKENGWGKTTLTVFLTVMFYGFVNEHKRSLLENERKRYTPWQRGTYGGQLVFVQKNKTYCLKRTFGKKLSEDTFNLTDATTNLASNDFSSRLGEEFFGIDRESFEKTLYLAQQDCQTNVTPGISAKIGNLTDEQADISGYETVKQKLKETLNHLTPKRKTGEINRLEQQKSELLAQLNQRPVVLKQASELKEKSSKQKLAVQQLQQQQAVLQQKMQALSKLKDQQVLTTQYQALKSQQQRLKAQLAEMKSSFPKGLPALEELSTCQQLAGQLENQRQLLQEQVLTPRQQQQLAELQQQFLACSVDQTVLKQRTADLFRLQELQQVSKNQQLSESEFQQLQNEQQYFTQHSLDKQQLENLSTLLRHYKAAEILLQQKNAAFSAWQQLNPEPKILDPKKQLLIWLTAAWGILAIIWLLIFHQPFWGVFLLIITGITGWLAKKQANQQEEKIKSQSKQSVDLANEVQRAQIDLQQLADELLKKLQVAQLNLTIAELAAQLPALQLQYQQFKQLQQRFQATQNSQQNIEIYQLKQKISAFLADYGIKVTTENEFSTQLQQLTFNWRQYQQLRKQQQTVDKKKAAIKSESLQLSSFFAEYGLKQLPEISTQLQKLRDVLLKITDLQQKWQENSAAIAKFKEKYNVSQLAEPIIGNPETLEKINQKFTENKRQTDHLQTQLNIFADQQTQLFDQLQQLDQAADQLDQLQEKLAAVKQRYQIIKLTDKYLKKAKDNFSARYMQPIMTAFEHYHQYLAATDPHQYQLDAELNLRVKGVSRQHDLEFLSDGYQDLIGICRRMSLIDAMYPQAQPPIIFDDPFANLDQAKLQGGLRLLQKLGKDHQIIYLTCHPSRTLTAIGRNS
jgi:DNA repair exonuclease SbcCD ATPase subunit